MFGRINNTFPPIATPAAAAVPAFMLAARVRLACKHGNLIFTFVYKTLVNTCVCLVCTTNNREGTALLSSKQSRPPRTLFRPSRTVAWLECAAKLLLTTYIPDVVGEARLNKGAHAGLYNVNN